MGDRAFVAADLEGTLTAGETWKGIGRYFSQHGRSTAYRRFLVARLPWPLIASVYPRLRQPLRNRWMVDLATLFHGATETDLRRMAEWVVDRELWPKRREALAAEIARLQAQGLGLVLASGTFDVVLQEMARRLGAVALGTPLEMVDGRATGRLAGPVNTGATKAERLRQFLDGRELAVAYGDTSADLEMLALAERAVAVAPDAALARVARERGWRVAASA